jgi:hypothetical protein
MATAVRRPPAKSSKTHEPEPVRRHASPPPAVPEVPDKRDDAVKPAKAKKAKRANGKRIRGSFSMPEADHARIARLKTTAKRNGLKVKKNELLRLGLRALQSLTGPELHDAILSLRIAAPAKKKAK